MTDKEVKIKLPKEFKDKVEEFFKCIGEGPFYNLCYGRISIIRKAANNAGFDLVKNKRTSGYSIFKKRSKEKQSYLFKPDSLDLDDVKDKSI